MIRAEKERLFMVFSVDKINTKYKTFSLMTLLYFVNLQMLTH